MDQTTVSGRETGHAPDLGRGIAGVHPEEPLPVAWNWTTIPFAVPADRASTHFPLFSALTVYHPSGVIAVCAPAPPRSGTP